MLRRRRSLLWLLVPYVLYLAVLPLVNRVHPVVLTMPFFTFWILIAVLATPLCIWLAARRDPVWRHEHDTDGDGGDNSVPREEGSEQR